MALNNFHSQSIEGVIKSLKSFEKGLSLKEAKKRLEKYGLNKLPEKKKINGLFLFLKQFHSFLIYILILAAVISYFMGHLIDVYVIVVVILINAGIGFSQEYRAEKAIKSLKKMVVSYAKVYRDNELLKVNAKELVVGDVLILEQGDKVPADARIIELKNLQTVESSLTGESFPVDKSLKLLSEKISLADRKNMVFMGTFVTSGSAKVIVVATGADTAVGKIAKDIGEIKRVKSHFKQKADVLAKQMGLIALIGALIVFLIGYFIRDFEFSEIFLFTLASLVSAIPEGLPAVLAIVLAVGAFRMSKRKAIVRNLPATESLGVVTTIITDKTGTLTENTMNIQKIVLPGQLEINVSGKGWEPKGDFFQDKNKINPRENMQLFKLLNISAICNNSKILKKENDHTKYEVLGDPTEASFVVLAEKAGLKKQELKKQQKRIDDLPFNPELKYRASLSVLINEGNKKQIYVIGAPEAVLAHSNRFLKNNNKKLLGDLAKKQFLKDLDSLTKKAMRVLAVAYSEVDSSVENLSDKIIDNLTLVGFVGIRDPPRPEVRKAINKAKMAGIRVMMVTGDHKGTAVAIAKEIGLVKGKVQAYTGQELEEMNKDEFKTTVKEVNVFARLTPNMKLKIAEELQRQGQVIAMTGDGVNDAPALKKADIGISMGIIGTDVARESSEIVLADDNFASIVNAVEQGRIVFTNTQQASGFLITTNFAENATIIGTLLLGMPLPLLPTQILWLNLVTDGVTDVGLALEPGHHDVLNEKPRNKNENILSKEILPFLILMSGLMMVLTIIVFNYFLPSGLDKARTGAFVIMSLTQLFNVFNMRSLKQSVFKIGFFSNNFLSVALIASFLLMLGVIYISFFQGIFSFVSLGIWEFVVLFFLSSFVFIFGEGYKFVRRKYKR